MLCGAGRVSIAYASAARPPPVQIASTRSRPRRHRARAWRCAGHPASTRFGSQRRPSRNSTMVTTSTASCVSARSGAENQAKVRQIDEADDGQHRQRGEAMELGLPRGRRRRTAHADEPEQRRTRVSRARAAGRPTRARTIQQRRRAPRARRDDHISSSCGCSRRVPTSRDARRAQRGRSRQRALEQRACRRGDGSAAARLNAPRSSCLRSDA